MKENANDDNIEIVLSSIIHSRDNDSKGKINETNRKLENLCKGKGLILIKITTLAALVPTESNYS